MLIDVADELESFAAGGAGHPVEGVFDTGAQIERLRMQLHSAGFDRRNRECR
jgi:hypothetical protein